MDINTFEKRWLGHFASEVSAENIEKYVVSTGDYVWHVFSWKLLPEGTYLVGDEARQAYNRADKNNAIFLDAFGEKETKKLPQELAAASALEALTEIYVVAEDFSWTYIKTHEGDHCGPYFCSIGK